MARVCTDSSARYNLCADRLPPGAAAVLINRAHTFRDLFLPIAALQKRLFDVIDGRLSIGKIVQAASASSERAENVEAACKFFEQLWWQDQVVFDTSRPR